LNESPADARRETKVLVIARKESERFLIFAPGVGPITVTVTEITRGKVWVGIAAEESVKIYREELLARVGKAAVPAPRPTEAKP
jgi:sRNA-binding carbon storage regulator CsrA